MALLPHRKHPRVINLLKKQDRARKTIGEGHTSHGLYLVDLHNKDLTARQNVNDGLQISNIEDHDRNSRFWIATNRNHFSA
ncbi:uncharacterized protein LOC110008149 isoform X4 [Amborella trichopoda]|uniref:uncharacterized protein LOC110008149 isoform X4 n=1 Tax=Amborella trichopoda TaxID=13333 RepID=UPI0009C01326|nr:uncharacterized protein LOC110008149 isoform X4 [Amborella trichopoda]|eukprot:XP_020529483.1 uncharacterized protein LOC110008149 isoform X4 [Amborella trichopoda]